MRVPPPPQFAGAYASMADPYRPPAASYASLTARAMPGTRIYPEPPPGCFWASENLFWEVVPGTVLVRSHQPTTDRVHNGHRWIESALVSLYQADGRELENIYLPSSSLSRDVAHLNRWTPIGVVRDGPRKPWRTVMVPSGPWHERAAELNERDA